VAVVNLDPANTSPPYEVAVDVAELVRLEEVMDEFQLGPNGALIYYIDHLRENVDWLHDKLRPLEGHYLLFDLPGQVRTHVSSASSVHAVGGLVRLAPVRTAERISGGYGTWWCALSHGAKPRRHSGFSVYFKLRARGRAVLHLQLHSLRLLPPTRERLSSLRLAP